VICVE